MTQKTSREFFLRIRTWPDWPGAANVSLVCREGPAETASLCGGPWPLPLAEKLAETLGLRVEREERNYFTDKT